MIVAGEKQNFIQNRQVTLLAPNFYLQISAIMRKCIYALSHECFFMGDSMITKVGQQILSELESEQSMDVADKKWWFVFKDVGSIPHFLWHLFKAFATSIFVYSTTVLVFGVAILDEHSIQMLLSQPLSEVIELKRGLIQVVLSVTTIYLGFDSYRYWRNYQSMKQQYQSDNVLFYNDQKLQIELIEEVLYRHKLIDRKDA
jgi:hypothetical protein